MTFVDNSGVSEPTGEGATQNQSLTGAHTQIRREPGTNSYQQLCPNCGEWVRISAKKNPYSLSVHLEGKPCHRTTEKKARTRVDSEARTRRTTLGYAIEPGSGRSLPAPEPLIRTAVTSPSSSLSSLPHPVLPGQPSWAPTTHDVTMLDTQQVPPSSLNSITLPPISSLLSQDSSMATSPGFEAKSNIPCYGARVKWECGHPSETYPFQYHDTKFPTWSVSTQRPPDADVICLRSFFCTTYHDPSIEACVECSKLPSSNKVQSLMLRASNDPAPTVPWKYLSRPQIIQKLKDKTDECRRYKRKVRLAPCYCKPNTDQCLGPGIVSQLIPVNTAT